MNSGPEHLKAEMARVRVGLADLQAEHAALADPDVIALDDEHDSEGSTVGFERARVAGLIERSRRHLAELESAAQRVTAGVYGVCACCGGPIGDERLEALPATKLCVSCASRGSSGWS
jgi:DnaK suppressor protein